jgi:hypothetical protein
MMDGEWVHTGQGVGEGGIVWAGVGLAGQQDEQPGQAGQGGQGAGVKTEPTHIQKV